MHVRQAPFRLYRSAVFAAVTVSASALLHIWGGGAVPRPAPFAGALILAFVLAFAVGGREHGFGSLAPLCLAIQVGMHVFFQSGAVTGELHDHGSGVAMLSAHLIAGLTQAAWLARGEAALAALLDLLTLFFARVLRLRQSRTLVVVRPRTAPPGPAPLRRLEWVAVAIPRRGPPVPAL